MKKSAKPLSAKELAKLPDDQVDTSDVPELGEEFWRNAKLVNSRPRKKAVSLRIDEDVIAFFKEGGDGYQPRMNQVLRSFMLSVRKQD